MTEFGAQGLELDASLVAWGTDLLLVDGTWSNAHASKYKTPSAIKNPLRLRKNAYRVLLTRGRDASVLFVPPLSPLNETFDFLVASGMTVLDGE